MAELAVAFGSMKATYSLLIFGIQLDQVPDAVRRCLELVRTCHYDLQDLIKLRNEYLPLLETKPAILERINVIIENAHKGLIEVCQIVEKLRPEAHDGRTSFLSRLEWIFVNSREFSSQEPLVSRQHSSVIAEFNFLRQLVLMAPLVKEATEKEQKETKAPAAAWDNIALLDEMLGGGKKASVLTGADAFGSQEPLSVNQVRLGSRASPALVEPPPPYSGPGSSPALLTAFQSQYMSGMRTMQATATTLNMSSGGWGLSGHGGLATKPNSRFDSDGVALLFSDLKAASTPIQPATTLPLQSSASGVSSTLQPHGKISDSSGQETADLGVAQMSLYPCPPKAVGTGSSSVYSCASTMPQYGQGFQPSHQAQGYFTALQHGSSQSLYQARQHTSPEQSAMAASAVRSFTPTPVAESQGGIRGFHADVTPLVASNVYPQTPAASHVNPLPVYPSSLNDKPLPISPLTEYSFVAKPLSTIPQEMIYRHDGFESPPQSPPAHTVKVPLATTGGMQSIQGQLWQQPNVSNRFPDPTGLINTPSPAISTVPTPNIWAGLSNAAAQNSTQNLLVGRSPTPVQAAAGGERPIYLGQVGRRTHPVSMPLTYSAPRDDFLRDQQQAMQQPQRHSVSGIPVKQTSSLADVSPRSEFSVASAPVTSGLHLSSSAHYQQSIMHDQQHGPYTLQAAQDTDASDSTIRQHNVVAPPVANDAAELSCGTTISSYTNAGSAPGEIDPFFMSHGSIPYFGVASISSQPQELSSVVFEPDPAELE